MRRLPSLGGTIHPFIRHALLLAARGADSVAADERQLPCAVDRLVDQDGGDCRVTLAFEILAEMNISPGVEFAPAVGPECRVGNTRAFIHAVFGDGAPVIVIVVDFPPDPSQMIVVDQFVAGAREPP